jgi:hypothetical protein
VTTENTTTVDSRENAYGTTPISWWGWPDEARLADFAGQDVRAEKDDRVEQADRPIKDDSAYAALYFVS